MCISDERGQINHSQKESDDPDRPERAPGIAQQDFHVHTVRIFVVFLLRERRADPDSELPCTYETIQKGRGNVGDSIGIPACL